MIRICGVVLPENKGVGIALTKIFGIGRKIGFDVVEKLNIDYNIRCNSLSKNQISDIEDYINKNYKVEGNLKNEIRNNISRMRTINNYRAQRRRHRLPTKSRTSSNANTMKHHMKASFIENGYTGLTK